MGRPTDRQWKWVVLVAAYTGVVILCTTMYMGGILYVAILDKYPGSTAKASLILSLNGGLHGLFAPVVSYITNSISCRFSMFLGGILLTASGFLSAIVNSPDVLLVTYGILGGIGNAMVGVPFITVLGFYFNKRRDFVISLSRTMVAFGLLIGAPLVTVLLETYGLNGTLLIIAAINAHLCIIGVLCKPSELELKIQANRNRTETDREVKLPSRDATKSRNRLKSFSKRFNVVLLTDGTFTLFLWSAFTVNVLYGILFIHLPNYTAVRGANAVQIALLTTCFNAGNMVGRVLGTAVVALKPLAILTSHTVQLGFVGIITLTFPYYDVFDIVKYVFAVVVGLCTGAPSALMTPISLQLVGVDNIATAHGLEYFYYGIGYLVGPPIAGALYDSTGTYRTSFIFAGCLGVLGCLFAIAAKYRVVKRRETPKELVVESPQNVQSLLNRDTDEAEL